MDIKTWLAQQSRSATSVFHMGRYCNDWKATTHHTGKHSFHIVLEGECWLQIGNNQKTIPLNEGDIVFFFSDIPFYLVSSSDKRPEELPRKTMRPLNESTEEDTALMCGFLHPITYESELLFALMPEYLLITQDMQVNKKLRHLFELVKIECISTEKNCDLAITRLTDLLLVYVVEQVMDYHLVDVNLLQAAQSRPLTELLIQIIYSPSEEWSIERMAGLVSMSRSTFIRKVQTITSYSPNELVSRLRINVAVNLLRRGHSIDDVAVKVGYGSSSGFYKAFRKVTDITPADFARMLTSNAA
ncbi:AraC family transcriptional regulator [Citrobacter meridianamericanus]|uniref:AraC family transcriptional regulator n=1 Tax=Citrobacter meridianamericanus TaxID=2894201 RepID=UPI00351D46D4